DVVDLVAVDTDQHELLVRREPHARDAVLLDQIAQAGQDLAVDPAHRRRGADVEPAVLLLVDADVVAVAGRPLGGGVRNEFPAEVLVLENLAELLDAPVLDEELQAGPRPEPAIAVVPEDGDDAFPRV